MPQDRLSGAEGDRYGREFGRRVAAALGAEMVARGSNECLFNGERVVVKCAHQRTKSVGVPYKMMERIKAVFAAFEQDDGSYVVRRLPVERYAELSTPSRSNSVSAHRVGMVKRAVFEGEGEVVAVVRP